MKRFSRFLAPTVTAAALFTVFGAHPAQALFEVDCNEGGDTAGLTVAGGGDWDGDGVKDFAYSLPCGEVQDEERAGRVFIRSGANGKIMRRLRGTQEDQFFGTSLTWLPDLNNDGRAELAVGSPNFDALDEGVPQQPNGQVHLILNVGQVQVFSKRRNRPLFDITGDTEQGELGASIASAGDIDGDGTPDFVVGGTGLRNIRPDQRTGGVIFYAGRGGVEIERLTGVKGSQNMGLSVANVGEVDGDDMADVLIGSRRTPIGGIRNAGFIEVLSGDDLDEQLVTRSGTKNELMGSSADADGIEGDFIVGSPGARIDGLRDAGQVTLFAQNGTRILTVSEETPQRGSEFGTSVAAIGDIDDDGFTDYAAGAPFRSVLVSQQEGFIDEVGRLVVISGLDTSTIWEATGDIVDQNLAASVDSGIDFDDDGIQDVISGNPGDTVNGRRGSGSVRIYSGIDGVQLAEFGGRRGLETRIYAFSPGGLVNGYEPNGVLRTPRATVAFNAGLSIGVLDNAESPPRPGGQRIAVGTGHGGRDTRVNVLLAAERDTIIDSFDAFTNGERFGVTVSGGDLNNDERENLVAVQADSDDGQVLLRIFRQLDPDDADIPGWLLDAEFPVFIVGDEIDTGVDGLPTPVQINANGANVAVGNVSAIGGKEIVVAPAEGVPAVRTYARNGTLLAEFVAYDLSVNGVNVAIGDLDNDGRSEIITCPFQGQTLVRAFGFAGTSFIPPGADESTAFFPFGPSFSGGCQVGAADVDFDDEQEILVVAGSGGDDRVHAFEATGEPVEGFVPFSVGAESQIAGTDRFVRK